VVQDDSGIPVHYFKRDQWTFHPFGRYLGPIAIFPGRYQNQLAELYHRGPVKPLDWGMGYRWRTNESNVLLAVRKDIGTRQQLRPAISDTPAVKPQPAEAAAPVAASAQAEPLPPPATTQSAPAPAPEAAPVPPAEIPAKPALPTDAAQQSTSSGEGRR
jgi:hypothetical protein